MEIGPRLAGEVEIGPILAGEVEIGPHLAGEVEIGPRLAGEVEVGPRLAGEVEIGPLCCALVLWLCLGTPRILQSIDWEAVCEISVPNLGWDFAVFLKELAQIRKEEKEKKRRHLENIRSLKGMGYSTHAAQQALHAAGGNLDEALKAHGAHSHGLPRHPDLRGSFLRVSSPEAV
ncbi:hypothetical protein P7K49_025942 [Saguinus oedipus]|uniref:UBA domain-containing protein n=1 Tax=Saguinus oedipus TaxID=9490 RepID=A0ABQ9UK38_SAGOE|nr:hypothetical protein P7K49_025942 [Saguinus oedipus]